MNLKYFRNTSDDGMYLNSGEMPFNISFKSAYEYYFRKAKEQGMSDILAIKDAITKIRDNVRYYKRWYDHQECRPLIQ